ncbi:MAG: hypothetical protein IKN41_09000 [Candidatus Methanomethylophilaceae archaeon]|nr:hypothetical protein [Bacteroidales bacterium]MBR6911976.1 hypothetical protein [Candidatus Methanomethylophilaceae archaeon]
MKKAINCPPLYITILGFDGWGKTSFMTGVKHGLTRRDFALVRGVNGYYTDGTMLTRKYFKEWYEIKTRSTQSTRWKSEKENASNMTVIHGRKAVDLMWVDYPGGMLRDNEDIQNLIAGCIDKSKLVLLLMDGDLATREGQFDGTGVAMLNGEARIQKVNYQNGRDYVDQNIPLLFDNLMSHAGDIRIVPVITKTDLFQNRHNYREDVVHLQSVIDRCVRNYNLDCDNYTRFSSTKVSAYSPALVFTQILQDYNLL